MRRNHCNNPLLKSEIRFALGEAARYGLLVPVIFVFFFGFVLGVEPNRSSKGIGLQNPMEKQFNAPQPEKESQFTKRSQFTDDTIPQTTVEKPTEKPKIRQVSTATSTETAPPSVWDNPNGSVGNEMTLADWGIGSPSMIPTNPNASTSSFGSPNASSNINSYFNTEIPSSANSSNNPYAALYAQGMNNSIYGYGGYGYYDPNTGQIFANSYNPYANYNDPAGAYSGFNGYNNGYNNGYSGYYGQGMFNPYDSYGAATDNSGNEMSGQQQNNLYQALLLQELMLRQREEAAAEKKELSDVDKKKKDSDKDSPESQWTMKQLMPIQVSSPLGETMLSGVKMLSPFCTPTGPHRGVGQPLLNRSWLDHPYYFGGFCGWISGSQLVSGLIDQKNGGTGGLILGYNLNEYWGLEGRIHFASIDIKETAKGENEYIASYLLKNADPTLIPALTTRTNQLSIADIAVHYYPLGNAKWRPFFKYGLGLGRESFIDTYGQQHRENTVTMPLGVGLRYWWNENLAIQADLLDNVIFSSGIAKTQNNFAFCVGLTYSFGSSKKKRPTAYWPYIPSQGSKR